MKTSAGTIRIRLAGFRHLQGHAPIRREEWPVGEDCGYARSERGVSSVRYRTGQYDSVDW